ncbi:hypothetical protein GUJ93_ZPchr0007g5676 [Zizania palustris]|uniref:Uncharacterized protein n=1 Tax=Zizania palustris TaxID=103762 RepID=A0A8J5VZ92_ZIZPA|nr:hypothetical protein GUJ93_ZPchr0007g5676 [Zizania palustris]
MDLSFNFSDLGEYLTVDTVYSFSVDAPSRLINVKQYDKNAIKWGGNMAENLSSLRKRKTYLRKFVLTPQSSVACEPRVRQRAAEPRVEAVEFHLRLLCRIGRNLGSVRAAANRSSSIARHTSSASALHTLGIPLLGPLSVLLLLLLLPVLALGLLLIAAWRGLVGGEKHMIILLVIPLLLGLRFLRLHGARVLVGVGRRQSGTMVAAASGGEGID